MGAAALLLLPYWLVKGLQQGKYLSNLGERLGLSLGSLGKLPADHPGAIWIHAVSVGELLSCITLAKRLKEAYPNRPLWSRPRQSRANRWPANECNLPMLCSISPSTRDFVSVACCAPYGHLSS